MLRRLSRRWWLAPLLGLLAIGDGPSPGQGPGPTAWSPALSPFDPRLEPLRRANASWESRPGPSRAVVDQVCLVPDLPTYLAAIATWDRGHYFPVLFDEVESSFRFIRAFRPAKIVRLPRSAAPFPADQAWDRAVTAVGDSWKPENGSASTATKDRLRGDLVPRALGPTPPGVVLSSPRTSMLEAAVALAAGRFQPLIRLDYPKRFADVLTIDEADAFAQAVADKVAEKVPNYEALGDDCDFLTLAGDYPYRYREEKGDQDAVDDRIGRPIGAVRRWAFAGRLVGEPAESAYRAMCSLFLQPESAALFNTYDEKDLPWSVYAMQTAALRLSGFLNTAHLSGDPQASLGGWHEVFDPSNRFGLVLINSMGSPEVFGIRSRHAFAADIPRSVPAAVLMIHSFSAADPNDPKTIAGRWLANGAFVFYGSMHEPFVDAFRAPHLVAELIAQGLPLVVVARQMPGESRGMPWRLVFLGDPLYRIRPKKPGEPASRLARWGPTDRWTAYAETPRPADDPAPDRDTRLFLWSLRSALAGLQDLARRPDARPADELVETVDSIRREKLPAAFRPIFDSLLIEVLLEAKRRSALEARLAQVPEAERGPEVRRTLENLEAIDFFLVLSRKDPVKAAAAWLKVMKSSVHGNFKDQSGSLVTSLAETPGQLEAWRATLRIGLREQAGTPQADAITAELKRVEADLARKR